jgi:hypothetical protein
MAFFTDRFGIKEVADVKFYNTGDIIYNESKGELFLRETNVTPVLELETLKVSTLEFTGETTEARGGKGNAVLMSWDHSREATLTLEDALLSTKALNLLLSNSELTGDAAAQGASTVITIDANGFPGTYTVVGKTYARGTDGKDHLFTFLIFKAKVQSEATLTMEAEGDPSTLSMTLKVLRCVAEDATKMGAKSGEMIKLILDENTSGDKTPEITWPTQKATT